VGLGGEKQEVMADDDDCSRSGLDKGPSGVGEDTHFLSAARELRNDATTGSTGEHTYYSTAPQELWTEPLSNDLQDVTTSSTGECEYYSTAPQELWTELLSKDLQDLNFVAKTENNEGESSCVEVLLLEPSDLVLERELAEGGQAHVYFARCGKLPSSVVVKRLKDVSVDLFSLQRRMEKVMKIRKKNNSAICAVLGVGEDSDGNVCVVMEKMDGDLRTIIDGRIRILPDGCTPFPYEEAISMMMEIAEGMEDLHRCDLIHGDLKASNILWYADIMGGGDWHGNKLLFCCRMVIGDFDTSDGVVGTAFWRAPEVLQALKNRCKPVLSRATDVYSYGMVCYEILTACIPFEECAKSNYDIILSGRRPALPADLSQRMKELLHACWRADPQERPGWVWIIETLKEEEDWWSENKPSHLKSWNKIGPRKSRSSTVWEELLLPQSCCRSSTLFDTSSGFSLEQKLSSSVTDSPDQTEPVTRSLRRLSRVSVPRKNVLT
jgi:serine/threonine protein kinase